MNNLCTIKQDSENLIVLNKSKFFAYAFKVTSEEQVKHKLAVLEQNHPDATHICYAYELLNKQKCSDAGEPQGTAGKPILDCIQKKKIKNVLVAVVRYFGGIKLGAGGLVRAYSASASEVLAKTQIVQLSLYKNFSFDILPSEISKINSVKNTEEMKLVLIFGDPINVNVKCKDETKAIKQLQNILSRQLEITNLADIYD